MLTATILSSRRSSPGVWEAWDTKPPAAQRDDALAGDHAFLHRLEAITPEERRRFTLSMGPITVGFTEFVAMRLNEHAFHTWDIEVVSEPSATIPAEIAELVVDNLERPTRGVRWGKGRWEKSRAGVGWSQGTSQASSRGETMGDKSPRQNLSKKAGKSLKEKRAEKHLKAQAKSKTPIIAPDKHH